MVNDLKNSIGEFGCWRRCIGQALEERHLDIVPVAGAQRKRFELGRDRRAAGAMGRTEDNEQQYTHAVAYFYLQNGGPV
jgi:hypothetical protein